MKRIVILIALALVLTACSPRFQDLTAVENAGDSELVSEVKDPDSSTIYRNVDGFANMNVMCVNGDAILSRSTNYEDFIIIHLPAGNHNLCP